MMQVFLLEQLTMYGSLTSTCIYMQGNSCCRTAVGVGQRALSLSAHMAGGPPPPIPGPGEGDATTPAHRSIAGTTGMSLLRGTGGF